MIFNLMTIVHTEKEEKMRLIDADVLMPNAEYKGKYDTVNAYDIVNCPTIEAEPVRHGKWIRGDLVEIVFITEVYLWKCSECGEEFKEIENNIGHYHYCTNCGAEMDLDEVDDETK